jgi:anti-anti-sigma factor
MEIIEEKIPEGLVIRISGKLDHMGAVDVQKQLLACMQKQKCDFFVDLKEVSYLSSAGLRTLLLLAKEAKELKIDLCIIAPSAFVEETLKMTGALTYLHGYKDLETALKAKRK